MLPSPAQTSSFSRLSCLRPARRKGASGGLGGYTGSTLFEKPGSTREYALFPTKPCWSAALAQSGTSSLSSDPRFLGLTAGTPGTPIPSGPDPVLSPDGKAITATVPKTSNFSASLGLEWEAGLGKTDTHGYVAGALSLTNSGNGQGYPDGISVQITSSVPAQATVYGLAVSLGRSYTFGDAGGKTDLGGVSHNTSLTLIGFQLTRSVSDSGVKQYSFGLAAGLSFSRYDTRSLSGGAGGDYVH
jgi:hypothetical protein